MSLLRTTTQGVVWTSLSTIIRNLVYLLQIVILTRILSKEDFGMIAIVNVFIGLSQIFLDLGISVGILHKRDITKNQYSSLFWLNIMSGIVLTLIFFFIAPIISGYYEEPELRPIIGLLSLTIVFSSLGSQHRIVQQKYMRFKTMAIVDIIAASLSMCTSVLLAWKGKGVYSLVFGTLVGSATSSILYFIIGLSNDKNVSLHFRLAETYPFLKLGYFQIGSSVLDYLSGQIDVLLVKAYFGNEILGMYSLCLRITQIIYGSINPVFTKVLTPLLAGLQTDYSRLRGIYFKIVQTLTILNAPIYFLVSGFSTAILLFLYGDVYREGAFILTILALNACILTISNPVGSLQVALGKTKLGFYWTIYRIISTAIFIYIGVQFSIEIMVLMLLLLSLINFFVMWKMQIYTMIEMPLKEYVSAVVLPIGIAALLTSVLWVFFFNSTSLILIAVCGVVFLSLYSFFIRVLVKDIYMLEVVKKFLSNRRNKINI